MIQADIRKTTEVENMFNEIEKNFGNVRNTDEVQRELDMKFK